MGCRQPHTLASVTDSQQYDRITVRQKLSLTVNRFEIRGGGKDGPILGIAQQKRLALKEQVTFFADEARTQPVFAFKARQIMDLGATYDITDGAGNPIGWFQKDFGKSLLRSTFNVGVPSQGLEGSGHERNQVLAILRRVIDIGWPMHFDFAANDGTPILSVERAWAVRDVYDVQLPAAPNGARLDWRVGAALAVGLDVLMQR
ncbi:hypothetical protein SAMN04489720_2652 [Agrococcus jejuensis]|uniref:Uncharacterized protein n=1 Tax=Agrococcus jejuensis TaxID=399736 RepID=A0A1G8FWM1_9MICO|nr:hypothetical protein SAMN04489720_2652 [Agrococcus jejuensis]